MRNRDWLKLLFCLLVLYPFAVFLVWYAVGCIPLPVRPDDPSTPDDCEAMCVNLERLRCPGWRGSPGTDEIFGTADDIPCADVCRRVVTAGLGVSLYQRCVAKARDCAVVARCFD